MSSLRAVVESIKRWILTKQEVTNYKMDIWTDIILLIHPTMQCASNICSAASSLFDYAETHSDAKALHFVSFGWVWKKLSQSRRYYFMNLDHLHPSCLTEAFPVELISHVNCSALMSTVRISLAKCKVLGGEWEYPGLAVLPCPLWRTFSSSWPPNQSASCRERELPCPCHNKWLPWL